MMKELPEWAKWMARDKDGMLWMYSNKPEKYEERDVWYQLIGVGKYNIIDDLSGVNFPRVKWSDDEPTEIINTTINNTPLEKECASEKDMVNKPSHYVGIGGLEVEEVLRNFIPRYVDAYQGHRVASAIEYLLRAPAKNEEQDIEKAIKCLQMSLRIETGE